MLNQAREVMSFSVPADMNTELMHFFHGVMEEHLASLNDALLQVEMMQSENRPEVLRDIVRRFGNQLALNADVVRAGTIRIGHPVKLVLQPHRHGNGVTPLHAR